MIFRLYFFQFEKKLFSGCKYKYTHDLSENYREIKIDSQLHLQSFDIVQQILESKFVKLSFPFLHFYFGII